MTAVKPRLPTSPSYGLLSRQTCCAWEPVQIERPLWQEVLFTADFNVKPSVQFPTLGFVVERYWQIQNHVPEDFWYIHVQYHSQEDRVSANFTWQ